jgi:hypothetical protein
MNLLLHGSGEASQHQTTGESEVDSDIIWRGYRNFKLYVSSVPSLAARPPPIAESPVRRITDLPSLSLVTSPAPSGLSHSPPFFHHSTSTTVFSLSDYEKLWLQWFHRSELLISGRAVSATSFAGNNLSLFHPRPIKYLLACVGINRFQIKV